MPHYVLFPIHGIHGSHGGAKEWSDLKEEKRSLEKLGRTRVLNRRFDGYSINREAD
jgi:hypothetical protein